MKTARSLLRIPVPLRLVAIMLVAILIPSILITALGLFAVYRAEPMVREQLAYPVEQVLDRLRDRVAKEWDYRFLDLGRRIASVEPDDRFLLDLAAADDHIADVLVFAGGGFRRPSAESAAPSIEAPLFDPELERARKLEGREDREALAAYRPVAASGRPEAAIEALFGAARCHLRMGNWREAVRVLRSLVDRFGSTTDATGVARGLPALLRVIEISRDNGDFAGEQVAAMELASRLASRKDSFDAEAASFYLSRLKRYPEALRILQTEAGDASAEGSAHSPGAAEPAVAAVTAGPGALALPRDSGDVGLVDRLRLHAEDRAPGEERGYCRVSAADGTSVGFAFFRIPSGGTVYFQLDAEAYLRDVRLFTPELGIPDRSLRIVDPSGRPAGRESPGGHETTPLAVRALPRPLADHAVEYHPAPGEITEELRRLETSRVALFTWSIVVLVLMIVLGVSLTLRSVFREMRVTKLKTDFVSFVTHELKTPLTAIRMFTETLLLDRVTDDTDRRRCVELIDQEAARLSRLIEQILEFSRIERHQKVFHFQSGDMAEVVDEAVRIFLEHNRSSGCRIEVRKAQEHISRIKMDRASMIELLLNLLSNALKYSKDSKEIAVNVRESIDAITVEVVDRGIGIPKREQRKIFEKFYRAEDYLTREVEGTGLGLTFARYIAKVHSGDIKVQSQVNQGSTFILELRKNQVLAE